MSKPLTSPHQVPSPQEKSVDFNYSVIDPFTFTPTKTKPNSQDDSVDFNGSFDDPFALTPQKQSIPTPQSEGSLLGASEKEQLDQDRLRNVIFGKPKLSLSNIPISPIHQAPIDSVSEDTRPSKSLFRGKEDTTSTEEQNHFAPTSKATRTVSPFTRARYSFSTQQEGASNSDSEDSDVEPSSPVLSKSSSTPAISYTSQSHNTHLHSSHSHNALRGHFLGRRGQSLKSELRRINQKGVTFTTTENSTSPKSNHLPTPISTSSSSSDEEADVRILSFNEDSNSSQQSILSAVVDPYDIYSAQDGDDHDPTDYMFSSVTPDVSKIHDPSFCHGDPTHDNSFIVQQDLQRTVHTLTSNLIKKILKAFQKSSISDENIYLTAFHKSLSTCSEKGINDSCQAGNPAIKNLFPSDRNNVLTLKYDHTDLPDSATTLTLADGKISGNPTADSILPFVRIVNGMETEYLKSLQVEMRKKALKAIKNSKRYPTNLANFHRYFSGFSDDEIESLCDDPNNAVTSNLSISLDEQDGSFTLEYLVKEGETSPKIKVTKDALSSDQTESPSPKSFLPFITALKVEPETFTINRPDQAGFAAAESLEKKLKKTEEGGIDNSPHSKKVLHKAKKALLPSWQFFTEVENLALLALQNRPKQEIPTVLPTLSKEELNRRPSSFGALLLNSNLFNNSAAVVSTNGNTVEEVLRTALNITQEDLSSENKLKALAALLISESANFSITKKDNENIFTFTFPEPIDTIESHKGESFRKKIEINLIVNENGQAGFTSNGFTNYAVKPETAVNVNDSNAKEILRKVAKFIKQTKKQNKFPHKSAKEALSEIDNPNPDNVDQVLAAIDKQEQEEGSLCSKIKVSKITAVEIPKSSRLNQTPTLTLFRPELSGATSEPSNFDFSTTKKYTTLQSSKDLINEALAKAIQKSDVTQEEAAKLILIAIKNGGINNAKEQLALDLGAENSPEKIQQAVKFSKIFQQEMKKASMFTGNQNAKELVGMRLKRLTPDYALDLLRNSNQHVQPKANSDFVSMWKELRMDRVIKITPTPIVEQASSSAAAKPVNLTNSKSK